MFTFPMSMTSFRTPLTPVRLYLTDYSVSTSFPTGSFSQTLPGSFVLNTNITPQTGKKLSLITGSGVVNLSGSTSNSVDNEQRILWAIGISDPLKEGTIPQQTMSCALVGRYTGLQTNKCDVCICTYVWRPTTGQVVGYLLDFSSRFGTDFTSTTRASVTSTLHSGPSTVSILPTSFRVKNGDIIVWEVWTGIRTDNGANTTGISYNGNIIPEDGVANNNGASYIEFQLGIPL